MERQINRLSRLKFYSKLPDEFIPAKTLKEANAYAEKYFNLRCSYKGIDVRIANEWNRGVYDMKKEFLEVADKLKFIGTIQERNKHLREELTPILKDILFGDSNPSDEIVKRKINNQFKKWGLHKVNDEVCAKSLSYYENKNEVDKVFQKYVGITINKNRCIKYETLDADLEISTKVKYSPQCEKNRVRGLFDHEFAHQIDHQYGIGGMEEVKNIRFSHTNKELTEKLCQYAWDNNNPDPCSEMIAEAWAEYRNGENPREIATTIGKIIEKVRKK